MEQETICGSFAGLRFPWLKDQLEGVGAVSENFLAAGKRQEILLRLLYFYRISTAPGFRIQISFNSFKRERPE